ncbi:hypothetical protein ACFL2Z_00055 [Candidatus Eisenbacteria bacterium]|uniref:ETC complex I subunit n=1 Tax=Eiseniibacteriota bacterium TaxID=2212470 RepID=A0ABV6YMJ1_UNCEI
MSYPTHIDPPRRHITIHRETCGLPRPKMSDDQATWFENFDSVEAADEFAKKKGYRVDYCMSCFKVK